jgi:hypothetical protein
VAPLYGHRAKRLLPSAVYLELSPAGHCPHHEAPTAVNSIIAAFIDAVEVGQHHQHELMQVRELQVPCSVVPHQPYADLCGYHTSR